MISGPPLVYTQRGFVDGGSTQLNPGVAEMSTKPVTCGNVDQIGFRGFRGFFPAVPPTASQYQSDGFRRLPYGALLNETESPY